MSRNIKLTDDPITNNNIIDTVLVKIFPNSPAQVSFWKFMIRLIGYGILTFLGINYTF